MIDIHTHILPNVDDGPRKLETSIQMLEYEKKQGVDTVILTPHFVHGRNRYDKGSLKLAFENFRLKAKNINIDLILGNEIYYSSYVLDDLSSGEALALGNTKHILLEFNPGDSKEKIISGCQNIYNSGYRIILAHMERYIYLNKDSLDKLLRMDVKLQMNASYAKNLFKPARNRWHRSLLKEGLISYLATDTHNMNERRPDLYPDFFKRHLPDHAEDLLGGNAEKFLRN